MSYNADNYTYDIMDYIKDSDMVEDFLKKQQMISLELGKYELPIMIQNSLD